MSLIAFGVAITTPLTPSTRSWTDLTEVLWVRVTDRLDAHIDSLSTNLDVHSFTVAVRGLPSSGPSATAATAGGSLPPKAYALIRPHAIARRYAELAASLHCIGHAAPGSKLSVTE